MTHTWKNEIEGKECSICHIWKPMSEYYRRNDSSKDGYRANCKACCQAACKRNYIAKSEGILKQHAVYRREHAEELAEYFKRRYLKDPEYHKEKSRRYYHANKEWCRRRQREYRAQHPAQHNASNRKYNARHRNKCRLRLQRWRREHPEMNAAAKLRRRALELNADGAWYITGEMIEERKELYGNLCYICGAPATEIDHVKPLSRGGSNYPCNLRPICRSCNSRKNNKWPYPPAMLPSFPVSSHHEWFSTHNLCAHHLEG
jgi:5-methylcytosine-specific restriction endonuclease McrA